ncbi:MAG: TIGR02281 family clan AA aspartic protease [Caldimonas sp.]
MRYRAGFCAAALVFATAAAAQTVSVGGSLGQNALLVINGKPRNVAVGSVVEGVRLVSVTGQGAVVEVEGKRIALQIGGAQVNLGGKSSGSDSGGQIVLTAESGGHFFASGAINGKTVRFVVDTGATNISISQAEADRIGLAYKDGQRGYVNTANGAVPAYRVSLSSVRIGDVEVYNVEATVLPAPLTHVLLGNSFLNRFQMRRENDRMTLERRF